MNEGKVAENQSSRMSAGARGCGRSVGLRWKLRRLENTVTSSGRNQPAARGCRKAGASRFRSITEGLEHSILNEVWTECLLLGVFSFIMLKKPSAMVMFVHVVTARSPKGQTSILLSILRRSPPGRHARNPSRLGLNLHTALYQQASP